MFIHNFKYAFKMLFRDKMLIFWTFAFPIILGTFFNLAFSDIESSEKFDLLKIAVIENDAFQKNEMWRESFAALSDADNAERLFQTQYVSEDEAKRLLEDQEIVGYFMLTDHEPKVVVSSSGIEETILQYVTQEISQTEEMMLTVAESAMAKDETAAAGDQNAFYAQLYSEVMGIAQESEVRIQNISSENLSYTMIEFYTLIAMTCLYGGILGMVAVNQNLANMSSQGKRVSVSPTRKGKLIFSSVLAGYITQVIGIALLFVYTIFVLKVEYGHNLPLIILLTLCGCLAGLSLGIAIAVLVKSNDNVKTGIVISVTMVGCFLSGMMGITMKYIIDKNLPLLNRLNPANMITDGLYALYYYDTLDRYFINVASLLIFSLVMILVSISGLRRQRYDSI